MLVGQVHMLPDWWPSGMSCAPTGVEAWTLVLRYAWQAKAVWYVMCARAPDRCGCLSVCLSVLHIVRTQASLHGRPCRVLQTECKEQQLGVVRRQASLHCRPCRVLQTECKAQQLSVQNEPCLVPGELHEECCSSSVVVSHPCPRYPPLGEGTRSGL